MDPRSEANLQHVHPDLCKAIRAAAQSPQAFVVTYGIRTEAEERALVASGHSQTMHSRHLPQSHENMQACAVDVTPCDANGKVYFPTPADTPAVYSHIAAQIKEAAHELGIALQWGGDPVGAWIDGVMSHFRDWGHFQLDPSHYP